MFNTILVIVIMGVAALTAIGNKIAEHQQKNAGPRPRGQGGQGGQGGVQDEIERFLREVTGEANNDGPKRPPQRQRQQREQQSERLSMRQAEERRRRQEQERQQQPPQSLREREAAKAEQKRLEREAAEARKRQQRAERSKRDERRSRDDRTARERRSRESRDQPTVKVVRQGRSPHSEITRPEIESTVAEDAQVHLPHLVTGLGTAAAATPVAPLSMGTQGDMSGNFAESGDRLLKLLRNRNEVKKAMILNEVLSKPVSMRKRPS